MRRTFKHLFAEQFLFIMNVYSYVNQKCIMINIFIHIIWINYDEL